MKNVSDVQNLKTLLKISRTSLLKQHGIYNTFRRTNNFPSAAGIIFELDKGIGIRLLFFKKDLRHAHKTLFILR
jgi:hypothetical protein